MTENNRLQVSRGAPEGAALAQAGTIAEVKFEHDSLDLQNMDLMGFSGISRIYDGNRMGFNGVLLGTECDLVGSNSYIYIWYVYSNIHVIWIESALMDI